MLFLLHAVDVPEILAFAFVAIPILLKPFFCGVHAVASVPAVAGFLLLLTSVGLPDVDGSLTCC